MRIFTLTFVSLLSLSACSTFSVTHTNKDVQNVRPAAASVGSTVNVDHSFISDENFDKTTDEWEKARAAYLRDLDYAEIFRQNNKRNDVKLKSDLIESRYQIESAETAMYEEQDIPKALTDLQRAEQRFQQAIRLAGKEETKELKSTKWNLDNLQKSAQLSMAHSCVYPYSTGYHEIEARIESLLITL